MLGFETVGNATLIVHDGGPLLCTDPWIEGEAYFGSWGHRFAIPDEQLANIDACQYVWFSHGHPDHLNPGSLPRFRNRKILLPNHAGQRIKSDLEANGFNVRTLETAKWYTLSDRVRILCLTDYNQDAILLVDIDGRLLMNLNDCTNRDWTSFIRRTASKYEQSFLLRLINHGDADMMNFFDEDGRRHVPARIKSVPLGAKVRASLNAVGALYYVPFSTFHVYQRTDSAWANDYVVMGPDELLDDFRENPARILPANLRYDFETNRCEALDAAPLPLVPQPPERFGDNWSDQLDTSDAALATQYFKSIHALRGRVDFIRLVVGGKETVIPIAKRRFRTGISFEAPRNSLMKSIEWEVFDDMLIGNYMKTTLHNLTDLHPDFTPYVTKYADNGRARTRQELKDYFRSYRRQNPYAMMKHEIEIKTTQRLRRFVLSNEMLIKAAYTVYRHI